MDKTRLNTWLSLGIRNIQEKNLDNQSSEAFGRNRGGDRHSGRTLLKISEKKKLKLV